MKKIKNTKIYIIISLIVFCLIVAFLIRFLLQRREAQAFVSPPEIYLNEAISYSDSTYLAKEWLWEFGNGDISNSRGGQYKYRQPGSYRVRLTVNNSMQKEFMVNVREPVHLERDSMIRIVGPSVVMQDEHAVFRGLGTAREWRWSFGETGMTDSRDQVAIYSYRKAGTYSVELMTEDTKYPVRHEITVMPIYQEDETDARIQSGNDIKERLQAIVDGKPFNTNYNYIMTRYLCNNPNIIVTINEEKTNDFYSYCQGLKIVDKFNLTILDVTVFPDEKRSRCLKTFKVTQIKNRK